jgi:hypothetical protein
MSLIQTCRCEECGHAEIPCEPLGDVVREEWKVGDSTELG